MLGRGKINRRANSNAATPLDWIGLVVLARPSAVVGGTWPSFRPPSPPPRPQRRRCDRQTDRHGTPNGTSPLEACRRGLVDSIVFYAKEGIHLRFLRSRSEIQAVEWSRLLGATIQCTCIGRRRIGVLEPCRACSVQLTGLRLPSPDGRRL